MSEKTSQIDFSDPSISSNIGDLAFLIRLFISHKASAVNTQQIIFLADVLVTSLREAFSDVFNEAIQQNIEEKIKISSYFFYNARLMEGILDSMVEKCLENEGTRSTLPSYRLIKSLDPTVKPHEIKDWVRNALRREAT